MSTKTRKATIGGKQATPKGKGGAKGRKPVKPVKVRKERNWGPIAMFTVVGVLAAGMIGYAFWTQRNAEKLPWMEMAAEIEGITDYRSSRPEMLTNAHVTGVVQYEVIPPVGGDHNNLWQNCTGTVYSSQIPNEHAVHSLEHGAVWITYNPDTLSESQVDQLAGMVQGNDMMLMSPYPGLDSPISLQAWGYQLKVDNPSDARIGEFIRALRKNASIEPGATCGGGVTVTGTVPVDGPGGMQR
jgi:hypothetical protein